MKRILSFLIVALISFSIAGCSSRQKMIDTFDNYQIEIEKAIPYVYYDTLVLPNAKIDFREILDKNKCYGAFHEVYVIQKDTIWFGFSDFGSEDRDSVIWHIASMDVDDRKLNVCYSGEFYFGIANKTYSQNGSYKTDNGFYYDGKIVLTDHIKVIEYDLKTKKQSEFMASSYEFPTIDIKVESIDYNTILFSKNNNKKVFDLEQGRQTSKVFKELCKFEKQENWQGKTYLSELFEGVQIIDNHIYILCSVINWDGEIHALVFEYDFENNGCKYAFHCFMDDIIGNDLYVVPFE